ncbi:MAG TPA: TolC family protein [Myxococcales bacterium]|nr:TolC family protein [Myxococcales bacterium]
MNTIWKAGPLVAAMVGVSLGAAAQQQAQGQPAQQRVAQVMAPPPAPAQPRRKVSVKEAMRLAATQGPDVAAARAQAAVVRAGVEKAWTTWQPDLSASGTFDHTSAPSSIPAGSLGPGSPEVVIVAANSHFGSLQISQPLLTPQGLFLPGIANAAAEAAAHGADDTRERILLAVASAYFNLQAQDGLLTAARDAEQVALRREQDAKAQIAAGTAVELALLRAQTETAAARVQIANIQGNVQSFLPLLEALTGEPIEPLPISAQPVIPDLPTDETEPWENSYAVKSAASAVVAAQRTTRLDRFAWLPSVAAAARGQYNSNGGFAGTNTSYDLLVNINIPLYDRGERYAQLHEDQARLAQAQALLASARARSKATWDAARGNLSSAQVALQQATTQAELAGKTQQQVDASYRAGVATTLDLSDADQRKFLAQSSASLARSEVEVRKAELAVAAGALYRIALQE